MTSKIALCFIISGKHCVNKEAIWKKWIKANADIINVYFHYKDYSLIKSKWIQNHAIPQHLIQKTEYYNVVPAYMSVLSFAYVHDPNNQWFCLLTESCCPLIHPEQFRHLFLHNSQKSVIRWQPAYWNIEYHKRANLRHLSSRFHLANDPWFILCRYHVLKCQQFMIDYNKTYTLICRGGLANESIFAIMLETYLELGSLSRHQIVNKSSTLCNWEKMSTPTSPYVFKTGDKYETDYISTHIEDYSMFIRKINPSYPDELLLNNIYGGKRPFKQRWYFIFYGILYLLFVISLGVMVLR